MSCCCEINVNSPCTIDEAVKNALQVGGVTATIRTGGLAHQDNSTYPIMVLELLNPTNPRNVCSCVQWNSTLSLRAFSTSKEQGVDLANQATAILKDASLESQSGNILIIRATPPSQLQLEDELFLTRVNLQLVIWLPK